MRGHFVFSFLILFTINSLGQDLSQTYFDSLEDEELLRVFNEVDRDSLLAEKVARTYLNRGFARKDTIMIARGYDRLARIFSPYTNIRYADSIIGYTKDVVNNTYPAGGYIMKAYYYHKLNRLKEATENHLIAYDLAVDRDNMSQQIYILDFLIFHKAIWGNKTEALNLQTIRESLISEDNYLLSLQKDSRANSHLEIEQLFRQTQILSLQSRSFCYLKLNKLDSARFYADSAMTSLKGYKLYDYQEILHWNEEILMEIDYYDNDFKKTIKRAHNLLSQNWEGLDNTCYFNIYLFKGLAYGKLGQHNLRLENLRLSDSVFDQNPDMSIQPYHRTLFEELLNHFQAKGDSKKSIEYLTKLIYVDSVYKVNYQYFEPEHIRKFETPMLLETKNELIAKLEMDSKKSADRNWWIGGVLLVSLFVLSYYFNRQLIYKKRFNALLLETSDNLSSLRKVESLDISAEVVDHILAKLSRFEEKREFLTPNISLNSMAKKFDTNSNYLSRVINLKMGKNFSQYIHDLRIDYSMKELLSQKKFRYYTIKAIAEECGYTNAESFSRAFYKKNGIYPSYYIKKLNKASI